MKNNQDGRKEKQ